MESKKKLFHRKKKLIICITGASGFIGSHLVNQLSKENVSIRVLTRSTSNQFHEGIEIFVGDLLSPSFNFKGFLKNCDVVINCAGETVDYEIMKKLHIDSLAKIIKFIERIFIDEGKRVQLIQLSSVGVYGPASNPNQKRIIIESSKNNPIGQYEITKKMADDLIIKKGKDNLFSYTILRPSNVVGLRMPNQSFNHLLKAIKNKYFFYIGSRISISNYLHIDDLIEAIIICAKNNEALNQIFNLSNDCPLSEIVNKVSYTHGQKSYHLCLPANLIRLFSSLINKVIRLPINHNRINALVSRTKYPTCKIEKTLGFNFKKNIPDFSIEYLNSDND